MFKVWMRCEPIRQADGRWLPQVRLLEETPGGRVEHARLLADTDTTMETEHEARACAAELARRWLFRSVRSEMKA
jgi:hypothetical protein